MLKLSQKTQKTQFPRGPENQSLRLLRNCVFWVFWDSFSIWHYPDWVYWVLLEKPNKPNPWGAKCWQCLKKLKKRNYPKVLGTSLWDSWGAKTPGELRFLSFLRQLQHFALYELSLLRFVYEQLIVSIRSWWFHWFSVGKTNSINQKLGIAGTSRLKTILWRLFFGMMYSGNFNHLAQAPHRPCTHIYIYIYIYIYMQMAPT